MEYQEPVTETNTQESEAPTETPTPTVAEAVAAVQDAVAVVQDAAKSIVEAAWTENLWYKLPHYECKLCPFDTLSRSAIVDHVERVHPILHTGERRSSYFQYDRFDNVVTPEQEG